MELFNNEIVRSQHTARVDAGLAAFAAAVGRHGVRTTRLAGRVAGFWRVVRPGGLDRLTSYV